LNKPEVVELVTYVSFTWPNFRTPTNRDELRTLLGVWHSHLGDLDAGSVRAAVDAYAVEGHAFAPGPGQLRRRAAELASVAGAVPDADAAWAEVNDKIARVGWTVSLGAVLEWSHPAVAAAVAAIGWDTLCASTNTVADRAHFTRFYDAARERSIRHQAMPVSVAAVLEAAGAVKRLEAADL
jgi:hypothetical protein